MTHGDAAHDTERMASLRKRMRELIEEQRGITVKDEFDQVYANLGGSGMNAFTSHDSTFYFINVPSNKFELWAWMESDRLSDSVFREFYAERDVVHEERRLRIESTPTGIFNEQFDAMFWQSSPYGWPVIGWVSDLNAYTRAQAEAFYKTYYGPGNLVGVVVGDFEPGKVKPVIARYFSRLEKADPTPPVITLEMPQKAEKRMYAECDCPPAGRGALPHGAVRPRRQLRAGHAGLDPQRPNRPPLQAHGRGCQDRHERQCRFRTSQVRRLLLVLRRVQGRCDA